MKVYVTNYLTQGTFDAMADDPRAYTVEMGFSTAAAPELAGVFSTPGLALEGGIHAAMLELREDNTDPETGEPYLPSANPLDQAKWVNDKDEPYDETCPLRQDYYTEEEWGEINPALVGKPMGRPHYEVYLMDPRPVRTTPYDEGDTWACVVVQELELDKQEGDEN